MTDIHIEQITQELTWRLRRKALYPDAHIIDMAMPHDDESLHYGAFYENRLVAVASVLADGTSYEIRNMAIEPNLPQHIGLTLLAYITERVVESDAARLWSNVSPMLAEIYQDLGFRPVGETFNKDDTNYTVMTKSL